MKLRILVPMTMGLKEVGVGEIVSADDENAARMLRKGYAERIKKPKLVKPAKKAKPENE